MYQEIQKSSSGMSPTWEPIKNFSSLDSENCKIYFYTAAFYKRGYFWAKKEIYCFQDSLSWFYVFQSYILFQFYSKWICLISVFILLFYCNPLYFNLHPLEAISWSAAISMVAAIHEKLLSEILHVFLMQKQRKTLG